MSKNQPEIVPEVFELSNGLRVVYLHTNSPVAHLGVTFFAGSRFEAPNEIGLAHFLEHCVFKGTKKRKPLQILSRLDAVGGELNAYTTKEEICLYASFVKHHFVRSAELLADIVLNSTFPEKEIEKEKEVIIDEIISYKDSPSEKIFDDFEALLFENNTLGNNILGTEDTVNSFKQKDLINYVQNHFHLEKCAISFVGDLPKKEVERQLEKYFHSLKKHNLVSSNKASTLVLKSAPRKVKVYESNYQAHVSLGSLAPGYDHNDRRAITLLINILGGPALNSRLNLSVREKYGYSYSVEAQYMPFSDIGYWSVYFGTDPKNISKTLKVVYKEIKRLRDEILTEKQLNQAKEQLKGHIALGLESNVGLMQGLAKSILLFNQIDNIAEIYSQIDLLTSEELLRVAQTYFNEKDISELIFDVRENELNQLN